MKDTDSNFFHPLRYSKARPFSKKLSQKWTALDFVTDQKANEQIGDFMEIFREEVLKYDDTKAGEYIDRHIGNPSDIINQEFSLFAETLKFKNRGSNIFYFPPNISDLFKKTDVNDITIGNIKFPYKTFYAAFGPQKEFDIGFENTPGYYFDGAYIESLDDTILTIRLTSSRIDRDYKTETNWFKYPDVLFWITLEFENTEETLVSAVDRFIGKFQEDFKKWEDTPKTIEIDGETIQTNPLDNNSPARQKRLKRIVTNAEKFKEIARLIFNAICYLNYEKKEIISEYTNSPPKSLIDKLKRTKKSRDKAKIELELNRSGYTKINICGQTLNTETKDDLGSSGKELSTHWRRGHWRNQPVGQDKIERKLIWIQPTLVRKDKGEAVAGHIYTVK